MSIEIRPYTAPDRAACLSVFDGNVPLYFDQSERRYFAEFLESLPLAACPYLVLTDGPEVVGCGGVTFEDATSTAMMTWGMIARSRHRQGLGRVLLQARLALARDWRAEAELVLSTSQHSEGFYLAQGFERVAHEPDHYGPGIDRCDLIWRAARA